MKEVKMKAKLKEIRDAVDKKLSNARDLWLMTNTSGGPMNLPAMRYFARNGRLPVVKDMTVENDYEQDTGDR